MEAVPILGISVWLVAKIAALILLGMYLIFALVVVRQVQLMTDTIAVGFEVPIRLFSCLHLIFAVLVFLTALIML